MTYASFHLQLFSLVVFELDSHAGYKHIGSQPNIVFNIRLMLPKYQLLLIRMSVTENLNALIVLIYLQLVYCDFTLFECS